MHPLKAVVPLAVAVGLVAASPAAADSNGTAGHAAREPVGHLAGSDAGPPVFPGLVNGRLVRAQKALDRAVAKADDGVDDKAISALYRVRLQTKLAWRAAKYVIEHAPPPAPPGDGVLQLWSSAPGKVTVRAHASGTGRRIAAVADQFTTAGAVLSLQHIVAQTAIGMIDTSHGALRDSLSRTIFLALDQRDAAVAYIHSIDVPAPVGDGVARVSGAAHLTGAPVGGSWPTVMPPVADDIDDEINQIEGALGLSATMGAGIRSVLKDAEVQDIFTQRSINEFWPPVVGDG